MLLQNKPKVNLNKVNEFLLFHLIEKNNLIHTKHLLSNIPVGHRKQTLVEHIEAKEIPENEIDLILNKLIPIINNSNNSNSSNSHPVAIKQICLNGQYQPFIMFYTPSSSYNWNNSSKEGIIPFDTGIYVMEEEAFIKNSKFLQGQGTYLDLLKRLFDMESDIDSRPIRIGKLSISSSLSSSSPSSNSSSTQFFSRYNMPTHGSWNTVTCNLDENSPQLSCYHWTFQNLGYDKELWLPLWKKLYFQLSQETSAFQLPISEILFFQILIPGLKAFHDYELPQGIDAVFNSWSNLTYLNQASISVSQKGELILEKSNFT